MTCVLQHVGNLRYSYNWRAMLGLTADLELILQIFDAWNSYKFCNIPVVYLQMKSFTGS